MDYVFREESTNADVFNRVMKNDLKRNLFDGYNCTCFVYGMTGSGKTYTMFGDMCNDLT